MNITKIFATTAFIGASFAAEIQNQNVTQSQGFKGNWTQIFQTPAGPVLHTPTYVNFGGMQSGKCLNLNTKRINDTALVAPLVLYTDSTPEEFIAALVHSGLLKA